MLKAKKSIIACLLILSFFLLSTTNVFAAPNLQSNNSDVVKAKHVLHDKYIKYYHKMSDSEYTKRSNEIDMKVAEMHNAGVSQDTIDKFLEKYHIYKLETTSNNEIVPLTTQQGDVHLDTVFIYFDSETNQWILSTEGYWFSESGPIQEASPVISADTNVGGRDTIGIVLTNTYGNYQGVALVGFISWWGDQYSTINYNYNASSNDYEKGACSEYQDYVHRYTQSIDDEHYVGKAFGVTLKYNSAFVNYNGNATTFYAHTYSSTQLTGVTFGVSGKILGISFSMTPDEDWWRANSTNTQF